MRPSTSTRQNPPTKRPRRMPSDHVGVLVAAVLMIGVGWAGLAYLITTQTPRIGAELWLFFILLHLAVTGTVLPVIRYLNVSLFAGRGIPPGGVIVRQSVWVGLYVVICAWLQILRALSVPIMFFLASVFLVLEVFLRMREASSDDA
jgi:hypothetical protein